MTQKKWWGISTSLDLHNCEPKLLRNPAVIRQFITELVKLLKMQKHGPTRVERYGTRKLNGLSAMQFIKTSSIVVHCDDKGNRTFIDIFSCKKYNPKKAVDFSKKFFKAKGVFVHIEKRV